jgi:glutamine amidotransferase
MPGEERPITVKAPGPAIGDEVFFNLIKGLITRLIIVHLREAKLGEKTIENTHPFAADGWVFAHNGTIERYQEMEKELPGVTFKGQTDSERYFHFALKHIREKGGVREGIISAIDWIKAHGLEGGRNFLMSDGRSLYAYRCGRDLHYTVREVLPCEGVDVLSIDEGGTRPDSKPVRVVVVASETLTDDNWVELPEDSLLIVDEHLRISVECLSRAESQCC